MKKINGDISYFLPNRKKPITYSTIQTAKLLVVLSEIFFSINSVFKAIYRNQEAKNVLEKYINKGYGEKEAAEFFNNQLFFDSHLACFFYHEEEYAILLGNSPWLYTIEQVKERIEFKYEVNSRKWKIKKDIVGLIGIG